MEKDAFQRIVLAYDGSEWSEKARSLALSLARTYRASVTVVVAFAPMPRVAAVGEDDVQQIHDARDLADRVVQEFIAGGIDAEPNVLEGPAAEAILTTADTRKANLIVIGSRGMGQFKGLLLGSVSDQVIQHANVPVLVAR